MAIVSVPERIYKTVRRHLLPRWHRVEEAAFLYVVPTEDAFEYLEWFPVPASGFASRSAYCLELDDKTRAKVIKRAHDLGASIVELHSHLGRARPRFSPSDLAGFRDFVPHVLWRLKYLPYFAVVMTRTGFDGASYGSAGRMRLNGCTAFRWEAACFRRLSSPRSRITHMTNDRFDRQVRFFGQEGQERFAEARVAVVGVGGLGSHLVQQLAFLGVRAIALIDAKELDLTNRNRLVGAREDDPIPGTRKVNIAERMAEAIDGSIVVDKVFDSLVSKRGFDVLIGADYVFGCLDSEGARLVLTELSAAYAKPYVDVSSDILPGDPVNYGGQVCIAWSGNRSCLYCMNVLDRARAAVDLAGPEERRRQAEIYGIPSDLLDVAGPSVVSINGVVASLAVTEFMLSVAGIREPNRLLTYHGRTGKVTVSTNEPVPDCYYCKRLWGTGDRADVQRYVREGVGVFLR